MPEEATTPEQSTEEKQEPTVSAETADTSGDSFKSEESKTAVLADLAKERKERQELQARIDAYEAEKAEAEKAKLSDIERAQEEAREASERASLAEQELLRFKIAAEHGITDQEDIKLFLSGTDEEVLTAQAKRLSERSTPTGAPRPDPSQGAKDTDSKSNSEKVADAEKSGDDRAAAILKAQQLGQLSQNMSS